MRLADGTHRRSCISEPCIIQWDLKDTDVGSKILRSTFHLHNNKLKWLTNPVQNATPEYDQSRSDQIQVTSAFLAPILTVSNLDMAWATAAKAFLAGSAVSRQLSCRQGHPIQHAACGSHSAGISSRLLAMLAEKDDLGQ